MGKMMVAATAMDVRCPHCGKAAIFIQKDGYALWRCNDCRMSVNCYPGTNRPMGELAGIKLRKKRVEVHAAIDRLWICSNQRRRMYSDLAKYMGMSEQDCHISRMRFGQLRQVLEFCRQYRPEGDSRQRDILERKRKSRRKGWI